MIQINLKRGVFMRHKPMKIIGIKNRSHAQRQDYGIPHHFRGTVYSLEGCSPAEPSSASTDTTKFTHVNQHNKLTYQHVN